MREVLQYYRALVDDVVTLVVLGLAFVFFLQLVVFRWAERSSAVAAIYFSTTVGYVGGPFIAEIIATPKQMLGIYDRVVTWTLLSFLMTIIGIACSGSLRHRSGRLRPRTL
jgi:hypothetical protein